MSKALAIVAGALLLLAGLGYGGWKVHQITAASVKAQAELAAVVTANQAQTAALAVAKAAQANAEKQTSDLQARLVQIQATQQTVKSNLREVVSHAKPADQDLLSRKLPAAVVRLLPGAAQHGGADASPAAVNSG